MIKFFDYPNLNQRFKQELLGKVNKIIDEGQYIMGYELKNFEKQLAKYVGTKYAIGVNSGTDALFLSLKVLGIGEGDEVITVSHTFAGTVNAIVHTGAKPVLIDIDEDTYNMDPNLLEKAITPRTKAIIPVHLNGKVCDMILINQIAEANGLVVIEDACQALGAKHKGKMSGSFGSTGCFSFYPAKILGCFGDGGAVTTDSSEISNELYLLRDHSMNRVTGEFLSHGYNNRLDNIQAAILGAKLPYLSLFIENRRRIVDCYGVLGDKFITPKSSGENVFQHYVIRVKNRDMFVEYLYRKGIETMVFWRKPLHLHKGLGFNVKLPVTEKVCNEVVALPIYPELVMGDVMKIINVCLRWEYA